MWLSIHLYSSLFISILLHGYSNPRRVGLDFTTTLAHSLSFHGLRRAWTSQIGSPSTCRGGGVVERRGVTSGSVPSSHSLIRDLVSPNNDPTFQAKFWGWWMFILIQTRPDLCQLWENKDSRSELEKLAGRSSRCIFRLLWCCLCKQIAFMKHFDIHQLQPGHGLIESEMPKHDGCDLMNSM